MHVWDAFWPDLAVALIAALVGAVVTVVIGFATYRFELRRREREGVRQLANTLSTRRALTRTEPGQRVDTNVGIVEQDRLRCARSIMTARESVDTARQLTRPVSPVQTSLDTMTRACNIYLEVSEHDPDGYVIYLHELRTALAQAIEAAANQLGIDLPAPGSRAF